MNLSMDFVPPPSNTTFGVFCENPEKNRAWTMEDDGRKKFGSQVDEISSYRSYIITLDLV